MAPTIGKCPKCAMQFTNTTYVFGCFGCQRPYHAQCLDWPVDVSVSVDAMKIMKEIGMICCKTCRDMMVASSEDLQAGKRFRADPDKPSTTAETVIQQQKDKIKELTSQVEELRKIIDEADETPMGTPREDDFTVRNTNDDPVTKGQMGAFMKEMMSPFIDQVKNMIRSAMQNPSVPVQTRVVRTPRSNSQRPVTFADNRIFYFHTHLFVAVDDITKHFHFQQLHRLNEI